jgi:uncharacterized protein YndB with AHSA1/START domain
MSRTTTHADTPPEAVWEVLADPRLYATWVVGASTTRGVEGRWPEPGSRLHHTQLMIINDTTDVLECEPGRRLVLEARARPLVVAKVDITLEEERDGTKVVLDETATGGLAGALPRFVTGALIGVRNVETVRRLRRMAEIGWQLGRSAGEVVMQQASR